MGIGDPATADQIDQLVNKGGPGYRGFNPGGSTGPGGGGGFTSFSGFGGVGASPSGFGDNPNISLLVRKRFSLPMDSGAATGAPGAPVSAAAPQMTGPSMAGTPGGAPQPQNLFQQLSGAFGGGASGSYGTQPGGGFNTNPGGDQRNAGYWIDQNGIKRDAKGNVYTFNPNDPYGSFSGNMDPTALGAIQRLFGQAGGAGAFDPNGSQSYLNALLGGAQVDANALTQRGQNAIDLSGMDPAQAAATRLQGLQGTNQGVQDIMANARSQAASNAQALNQHILDLLYGQQSGWASAGQNAALQQYLQQQGANVQRQGQLGNLAGQLGGTVIGSFLP